MSIVSFPENVNNRGLAVLQRAIYVSDAVGTAGNSILSIAQILGVSDANNRRDHLTGVLMFHRGQFMQVVEGARVDVDRLVKRLAADCRHTNLRFLTNAPAEGRRFGGVPMAQVEVRDEIAELIGDRSLDSLTRAQIDAVFLAAVALNDLAA